MPTPMKPLSAQQIAQQQQQRQERLDQVARQQIAPSGNFRQLQHSAFSIAYPENWEAMGDRNSAVTIAPRAGVSENSIAYGVVISGIKPQPGQSLTDVAGQIFEGLRQSNPQLSAADSPLVLDDGQVLSNGNFHVPALSVAFEALGLAPRS